MQVDVDKILFLPNCLTQLRSMIPRIGIGAVKDIFRGSQQISGQDYGNLTRKRVHAGDEYFLWSDRVHGIHILVVNPDNNRPGCWALRAIVRVEEVSE